MKRVLMIMCVSMLAASMYASSVRNGGIIHQSITTTSSDPGPEEPSEVWEVTDEEVPL